MHDYRPTHIYVLRHPVTLEIRYVGKTVQQLSSRLSAHISDSVTSHKNTYTAKWIRRLHSLGLRPIIELVETVEDDWPDRERHWIEHHRAIGCRLTNLTLGGEGVLGLAHSLETRAKISEKQKGRPAPTAHTIALRVAKLKGRKHKEETRRAISERAKERYQNPQMRQQARASYNYSEEARACRLRGQRKRDPTTRNSLHAARLKRAAEQKANPRKPLLTGEEIRDCLKNIAYLQEDFAKALSLSHSCVSTWVNGKRAIPEWAAHRLQVISKRDPAYRHKDQILSRLLSILLGRIYI